MIRQLEGKTAVVTGASRGIGKGIALALGTAGATVYVTGRTLTSGPLPGTITATADEVTTLGGKGIAVVCDHRDDGQVAATFDRIRMESGKLDILVNNVFSSPDLATWLGKPCWELPLNVWDQVIGVGARSHYIATVCAAPLLFAAGGGLIVNVSSSGSRHYSHNTVYGVGKAALDKMTADMAIELRPRQVAVVSLWPGLVKTELIVSAAHVSGDGRSMIEVPGGGQFDLTFAESPLFVGRGVVALATDTAVMDRSGSVVPTVDLGHEYGFTDIDGTMPKANPLR